MEYVLFKLYPHDYSSFTQGFILTITVYGVSILAQFMRQCLNKKPERRSIQSNILHLKANNKQEPIQSI